VTEEVQPPRRPEGESARSGHAPATRDPGWELLPPELDPDAARMLADCPALGSVEAAAAAIAALRADPDGEVFGWLDGGELIAVYGLRKARLSFELPWLAVAQSMRARRYGRSALVDALRRCGRKPMTVEVDESAKGWFEGIGFRTVGRRPSPDGELRYRMGWYAPRLPQEAGYGAHGSRKSEFGRQE
jgi:ribosomal protein S18 acetylase RimI-like enzyme